MDVVIAAPSAADGAAFVDSVHASRSLHMPWIDPPDSAERFAIYLVQVARDDHAAYLIRHVTCGDLVGYATVSNIVRGAFQSAYLGYGAFAGHAGRGLMTQGLQLVLNAAFGEVALHRVEANIQPENTRSIALVRRLGFEKEGFSPRYLKVDGGWRDHERWAIRSERWLRGSTPGAGMHALDTGRP